MEPSQAFLYCSFEWLNANEEFAAMQPPRRRPQRSILATVTITHPHTERSIKRKGYFRPKHQRIRFVFFGKWILMPASKSELFLLPTHSNFDPIGRFALQITDAIREKFDLPFPENFDYFETEPLTFP